MLTAQCCARRACCVLCTLCCRLEESYCEPTYWVGITHISQGERWGIQMETQERQGLAHETNAGAGAGQAEGLYMGLCTRR